MDLDLEEINDFSSFSNHTPEYMFNNGSSSIQFYILQTLFDVLLLIISGISLKPLCMTNPDPKMLQQLQFGIVRTINTRLLYFEGAYLLPPQDPMQFWFCMFVLLETKNKNQLAGISLNSFSQQWLVKS